MGAGNLKNALYHQRYLSEFEYRFNRRFGDHPETCLRGAQDAADAGTATQVTLSLSGNPVLLYR